MNSLQLNFSGYEYAFMAVQGALMLLVLLGWARRLGAWWQAEPATSACLLAVCLGACLRLMAVFLLASIGFTYLATDDPCRWGMAWGWVQNPYAITHDGVWQTWDFALHGLPMMVLNDPLIASKLMAALFCLAPLAAMWVFTQGVFADRRLACAATLATAPLWLHVLLSTGAMAEMPTVTFFMAGVGLLTAALRRAPSRRRRAYLIGSALAFIAATSFHTTAWLQLVVVLGGLLVFAMSWRGQRVQFGPKAWFLFAMASSLFCLAWLVGCWFKFGNALHTFEIYSTLLARDFGEHSMQTALLTYPRCIALTLKSVLPLLGFGVLWSLFAKGAGGAMRRAALGAIAIGLLIMMATSATGHAAMQARSTILLATMLVPFMLAPFFPRPEPGTVQPTRPLNKVQRCVFAALALAAVCLFITTNYQNLISNQRMTEPLKADNIALGA